MATLLLAQLRVERLRVRDEETKAALECPARERNGPVSFQHQVGDEVLDELEPLCTIQVVLLLGWLGWHHLDHELFADEGTLLLGKVGLEARRLAQQGPTHDECGQAIQGAMVHPFSEIELIEQVVGPRVRPQQSTSLALTEALLQVFTDEHVHVAITRRLCDEGLAVGILRDPLGGHGEVALPQFLIDLRGPEVAVALSRRRQVGNDAATRQPREANVLDGVLLTRRHTHEGLGVGDLPGL